MTEKQQRRQAETPPTETSGAERAAAPAGGVDEAGGARDAAELERSVSDQELGPHQRKATPAPGTYEEPRPQTDPGWQDAGQRLTNRANDDQAELDERERDEGRS